MHTHVIQHITDNNRNRCLLRFLGEDHLATHDHGNAADRNGGTVGAALQKALVHELVEAGVRALRQELVQLNEKLNVRVAGGAVMADHTLRLGNTGQINTHDDA